MSKKSSMKDVIINSDQGVVLDTTGWVGLKTLTVATSNGTDNITVADSVALSVFDTAGNVTTTGGSTVRVQTDTSHSVNVNGGAATSSVKIIGGAGGTITDGGFESEAPDTISSVSITGSHNLTTIHSDALTSLSVIGESFGSVVVDAAAGARTLKLTMNGDAFTTVVDQTATTVNVATVGNASTPIAMTFASATSVSFNDAVGMAFISGGQLNAANDIFLTISGAGYFTGSLANLNASAVIDATGAKGLVTVQLAGAGTQSFTGGKGADVVTIGASQTGTVAGGSNHHNEIVLFDAAGASEANIAAVTHFSTLGVAGSTSGTFDMAVLSAYAAFDVQSSGGDVTFTHAQPGSVLSIDNNNAHIITLQTADSSAASDTATLNLGTATTGGITVSDVVLEDSTGTGIHTVDIVSNGTGTNTLTTLGSSTVTTLHLSGTAGLILSNLPANGITVSGASDDANNTISLGNGTNSVALGHGANSVTVGTGSNGVTYGAHSGGDDTTTVGANASLTTLTTINGTVLGDHLGIANATAFDATAITAAQVTAAGGSTGTFADWVNGALAAAGDNLAQNHAAWFQFHGDTYVVEQSAAAGTAFGAGDTIVELAHLIDLSGGSYDGVSHSILL